MTIESIIKNNNITKGLQLTKRKGVLTSTWVLFLKKGYYYYFDITERFIFDELHKYTLEELLKELSNSQFEIDLEVF